MRRGPTRSCPGSGRQYNILDIGCGTGLCGPLLKPLATSLTGVDLSPGMLDKARNRDVYDVLEEGELTAYMHDNPGKFDVVTCVDTFVYFGDLSRSICSVQWSLKSRWLVVFHRGTASSRKIIHPAIGCAHMDAIATPGTTSRTLLTNAGLTVESSEDVVLRNEGGKPVSGLLFSAQKR